MTIDANRPGATVEEEAERMRRVQSLPQSRPDDFLGTTNAASSLRHGGRKPPIKIEGMGGSVRSSPFFQKK